MRPSESLLFRVFNFQVNSIPCSIVRSHSKCNSKYHSIDRKLCFCSLMLVDRDRLTATFLFPEVQIICCHFILLEYPGRRYCIQYRRHLVCNINCFSCMSTYIPSFYPRTKGVPTTSSSRIYSLQLEESCHILVRISFRCYWMTWLIS